MKKTIPKKGLGYHNDKTYYFIQIKEDKKH